MPKHFGGSTISDLATPFCSWRNDNEKFSNLIETLAREKSEILSLAVETELHQIWRDRNLSQYIREEISQNDAIEKVGIDSVELAERLSQAVIEDL